tara:strand:- start:49 stop:291 length:243 start_codon:yes stop_codon:yes gene_type:complete
MFWKDAVNNKYKHLMNLVPDVRKKAKLPYSVNVLDEKLVELEKEYNRLQELDTNDKEDITRIENLITDLKSSITILIIGT